MVVVLLQVIVFAGGVHEARQAARHDRSARRGHGPYWPRHDKPVAPDDLSCGEKGTAVCGGCWSGKAFCTAPCHAEYPENSFNLASRENVQQEKKNLGQRVGEKVGKIADAPSRVRDKTAETVQKVKGRTD